MSTVIESSQIRSEFPQDQNKIRRAMDEFGVADLDSNNYGAMINSLLQGVRDSDRQRVMSTVYGFVRDSQLSEEDPTQ